LLINASACVLADSWRLASLATAASPIAIISSKMPATAALQQQQKTKNCQPVRPDRTGACQRP